MNPGRLLILAGLALIAAGVLFLAADKLGLRLGRLPGDIFIQRGKTGFYFPLATCLLVSVILTFLAWLLRR